MSQLTDRVDELFAGWDKADSPGCSLAVIQNGEIIYKRGYGMADLERNVPLSPASVFDIGSMGKQFMAMVIAILARQGALSLADSIRKHIPEMPAYAQPVTIGHLIHHLSGLRDYTTLMYFAGMRFENFYYEEEILDLICRQNNFDNRPGEEYQYSNTNYFLLGVIAKRVSRKSLPALFQAYILDPLGMKATSFNDDVGRIIKNRATGYAPQEAGYRNEMSFSGGFGDGMILTTVEDLFLWDQNFYQNKLGDYGNELIEEMLTPGVLNNGEQVNYGFGLWFDEYKGLRRIGHAGGWAGYRSDFIQFPAQKFSVICLANLSSIAPWQLSERVADIYLADVFKKGEQPGGQKEDSDGGGAREYPKLEAALAADYAGVYWSEELKARHEIVLDGEQLSFRRGYATAEALQPMERDFFQAGELHFQFERDENQRVHAFQLSAGRVRGIRFSRCSR